MGRSIGVAAALVLAAGCAEGDAGSAAQAPWQLDSAAFVTTGVENGHPDLYLVRNRQDTLWTRLTAREGLDNNPTWSPDGRQIVFHSDRSATGVPDLDLFVIEPGSGQPARQLTFEPGFDYLAEFAPDGRHIAFLSRRAELGYPEGSPGHIYVMDADGTNVRRVTTVPVNASLGPVWMPDGGSLLIARRLEEDGPTILSRVWLDLSLSGARTIATREEVLISDAYFNYPPHPSPDGRQLAYTAEGDGAARVILMNADGSGLRVLVDDGFNFVDGWTPDGQWIVVTRWYPAFQRRDAWLISPDGSQPDQELLSPVHRSASEVAFRPGPR